MSVSESESAASVEWEGPPDLTYEEELAAFANEPIFGDDIDPDGYDDYDGAIGPAE